MKRCRGGTDDEPAPLDVKDLILIYRIVGAMKDGVKDLFEIETIKNLRKHFELYLSKHPERIKAIESQLRVVSDPEEASDSFELMFTALNGEEVRTTLQTQFLMEDLAKYKMLHNMSVSSASVGAGIFYNLERKQLQDLLALEIRYLRGCDIVWVTHSDPSKDPTVPTSGPCCPRHPNSQFILMC